MLEPNTERLIFAAVNSLAAAVSSMVLAGLVIDIVGTTWGRIRATHAEADAVREAGEKTVALATAKENELESHKQETPPYLKHLGCLLLVRDLIGQLRS